VTGSHAHRPQDRGTLGVVGVLETREHFVALFECAWRVR
jgi:hypothetical protein